MILKLSIADELIPEVRSATNACSLWKKLKSKYETSDKGRTLYLKNLLYSTKLVEGASVSEHLLKLKDIKDQLLAIGKEVEEEDMVVVVLNNLPPSFEHFVETINMTADEDLTFDQVSSFLLQKERWRTHFQGESSGSDMAQESAFAAKTKATRRKEHPLLHFKGNTGGAQQQFRGNPSGNTSISDSTCHSSRSRIRCF